MKAMILAAGLGTRLRPWTLTHPKALVPVGGIPMLQRVMERLVGEGFDRIVINIHHFGEQILDFLSSRDFGAEISVSDERGLLLDTGGGILKAADFLAVDDEPFLVHNVDILSDAPLGELMKVQCAGATDATLLVSDRDSARKLIIDGQEGKEKLVGWHNLKEDKYRWKGNGVLPEGAHMKERAFSGIYAMSPASFDKMGEKGRAFPIMDFFLDEKTSIGLMEVKSLAIMDIGKPATLKMAEQLIKN